MRNHARRRAASRRCRRPAGRSADRPAPRRARRSPARCRAPARTPARPRSTASSRRPAPNQRAARPVVPYSTNVPTIAAAPSAPRRRPAPAERRGAEMTDDRGVDEQVQRLGGQHHERRGGQAPAAVASSRRSPQSRSRPAPPSGARNSRVARYFALRTQTISHHSTRESSSSSTGSRGLRYGSASTGRHCPFAHPRHLGVGCGRHRQQRRRCAWPFGHRVQPEGQRRREPHPVCRPTSLRSTPLADSSAAAESCAAPSSPKTV